MKQAQRREIGKETNQTSYGVKSKLFYVLGETSSRYCTEVMPVLYQGID